MWRSGWSLLGVNTTSIGNSSGKCTTAACSVSVPFSHRSRSNCVSEEKRIFQKLGQQLTSKTHVRNFLSTPMPEIQKFPEIQSYEELHKFSLEKPELFWGALAGRLEWNTNFSSVVQGDFTTGVKWFTGGKLNASVNCVDRHAKANPDKVAIIFEKDEPNQHEFITYGQLLKRVKKYAAILRNVGNVKKGDRVAIYMPCGPSAVAMILACSRIGAIHSVVFAGFSSDALASRINDAQASVLVTTDITVRGGKTLKLKKVADQALESCPTIKTCLVDSRDGSSNNTHMKHPRDHFLHDLEKTDDTNDVIEYVDSHDPLFILYTSGSTGAPKGLIHSTANYLLYAQVTQNQVFDFDGNAGDKFGCVADIGWITGHTYATYGPLLNGGTTLLFESTPIYPNPGRYWEMVQRLKLTHFYCAPTAIRLLIKMGTKWVKDYDRSSLRVLGSVGEPINYEAWTWYNEVVGEKKCTVIDTWWQTETGGVSLAPRPSGPNDPIEPAQPMRPFFGIKPIFPNQTEGEGEGPLCIERPWPGLASGIWNSPGRYNETYFSQYPPYYFTGDGATRSKEGYWKITGRMDDVINVTGHRLGTAEVEDALGKHLLVSESAVVGYPHDVKGEGIFAFVVLKEKGKRMDRDEIQKELRSICKVKIAGYAIPDYFLFTDNLPKTRSGKIMRRILRKIASGGTVDDLGDISTLAEPQVVHKILEGRAKLVSGK